MPNPVSANAVALICRDLIGEKQVSRGSVSITGGEPLMQNEFVGELASEMHGLGLSVHLETNGTLWKELSSVVDHIDVVAMDVKLPSATGRPTCWEVHEKFLKAAGASARVGPRRAIGRASDAAPADRA